MTSWKETLKGPPNFVGGGSFRGKPFYVKSATTDVGRRTVTHEFPGSDKAAVDDLGKAVPKYKLEAYVLGDGYMAARDALRTEFEKLGAGQLIHPWYGKKTVTVEGRIQIEDSWDHGGMAKFTLNVVEAGELKEPFETPATAELTKAKSLSLREKMTAAFTAGFSAATSATNAVTSVLTAANSAKGKINAVMNTVDTIGDTIAEAAATVSTLIALPSSLASTLTSVVTSVVGSINNIGTTWDTYFGNGETPSSTSSPTLAPTAASPASSDARAAFVLSITQDILDAMDALAAVTRTTPDGLIEAANQALISLLAKVAVVSSVCEIATDLPYGSSDAALSMRETLIDQLDALTELTGDDATYAALCELRSEIYRHLTQTAASLPSIVEYTPPKTTTAMQISQLLYGTPDMADDIINRNNIHDPTSVPGGVAIEVLSA